MVTRYIPEQVMQGQTEEVEARAEIFPSPAPSGKLNRVTRYHKGLKGRGEGGKKKQPRLVPRKRRANGLGGLNFSGMYFKKKSQKKSGLTKPRLPDYHIRHTFKRITRKKESKQAKAKVTSLQRHTLKAHCKRNLGE